MLLVVVFWPHNARAWLWFSSLQALASPSSSAIFAPRAPIGLGRPLVVSFAVWCSISALISAPTRTTMVESHIHTMKPITAPSDP